MILHINDEDIKLNVILYCILWQDVKRSEIYSIRSILITAVSKVGLLYEDSEPYRILAALISELDAAYDSNLPLNIAVEEDEEGGVEGGGGGNGGGEEK